MNKLTQWDTAIKEHGVIFSFVAHLL